MVGARAQNEDQSLFNLNQEAILPPPELYAPKSGHKRWFLAMGIVLVMTVILLIASRQKPIETSDTLVAITPTPTMGLSDLWQQIEKMGQEMEDIDPTREFDSLPPVDMQLEF